MVYVEQWITSWVFGMMWTWIVPWNRFAIDGDLIFFIYILIFNFFYKCCSLVLLQCLVLSQDPQEKNCRTSGRSSDIKMATLLHQGLWSNSANFSCHDHPYCILHQIILSSFPSWSIRCWLWQDQWNSEQSVSGTASVTILPFLLVFCLTTSTFTQLMPLTLSLQQVPLYHDLP